MVTLLTREAPAEVVGLRACCDARRQCADCRARHTEVRAARRDAVIHAVARRRARR